jgi:hypothetical protein
MTYFTPTVDLGYSQWKIKTSDREIVIPNALHQLGVGEFQQIVNSARGKPDPDYIWIDGLPYAVGATAERHGIPTRPKGAARYTRSYYGVALAAMLAHGYSISGEVSAFIGHPPRDNQYAVDIRAAVLGPWTVWQCGQEKAFVVAEAFTFEEPLGGLMNVVLNEQGTNYLHNDLPIETEYGLIIDIGGHTVNILAAKPGGEPDFSLNESVTIGIDDALDSFVKSIRTNYAGLFRTSRHPGRPETIRAALATGKLRASGRELDVSQEAQQATSLLLNEIGRIYLGMADGPAPWGYIVLTGGGGGLLSERLKADVLDHPRVFLADDPDSIDRANMRGGAKIRRALGQNGQL